jgi:DnaJ family protein B protein 12
MEVNKYEAERCIEIARKKEANGDLDGALKFVRKSINLFPTSLAEKYELKLKDAILNNPQDAKTKEQPAANNTSGSSSSSNNVRQRASAASSAKSSTPAQPERSYTTEQVEAVRKIKLVQTDYYKVLSIEKDANESQVKKAYRKVNIPILI